MKNSKISVTYIVYSRAYLIYEPQHEFSNKVVFATS